MQKKAAASFDKAVIKWKSDTENRHNQIKFLEEVMNNLNAHDEDAMEICTVDFSVEAVSRCKHYSDEVYKASREMLPIKNQDDLFEDTDILSIMDMLKGDNSHKFR